MQTSYIFFLGRIPTLSLAELKAVLGESSIEEVTNTPQGGAVATVADRIAHPQPFLNRLGGTMKIAEVFHTLEGTEAPHTHHIVEHIFRYLHDRFSESGKKVVFGVSFYHAQLGASFSHSNAKPSEIAKKLKKLLHQHGHKARFVNKGDAKIDNYVVQKVLTGGKGIEIVIAQGKNTLYFGETVAVQDIESYGKRDYERPARSMKIGMLPPKVAQIMINLAIGQNKNIRAVYDPFCGTGTILTEAMLAGYDVIGSDIAPQALEAAKKNIEWLQKNFPETQKRKFHLFLKDATKIAPPDFPFPFDTIVTETYLGPMLQRPITDKEFRNVSEELLQLYRNFLSNLNRMFDPAKARLVIAIPTFKQKNSYLHIPLFPHQQGFIYDRAGQHVGREIFVRPSRQTA